MIKSFTYEAGDYTLYCEGGKEVLGLTLKEEVIITSYGGGGSKLIIPETICVDGEEIAVSAIGKKAFLGCNSLREVSIPESVKIIDDWGFAQCEHLKTVIIRSNSMDGIVFGRGAFEDCKGIEYICLGTEEKNALAALLAAVIYRMDAEYLLRSEDLGTENWFAKWDQCLLAFLTEGDEEGYADVVLCGEEDLGSSLSEYVTNKRKRKSALCLLRLAHDELLSDMYRKEFVDYLLEHTKGSETEEAWQVILSDFSEETDYFKLFARLGCVNENNIDDMLIDMGGNFAEAKAFLLGYKQEHFEQKDFFATFEL